MSLERRVGDAGEGHLDVSFSVSIHSMPSIEDQGHKLSLSLPSLCLSQYFDSGAAFTYLPCRASRFSVRL